MLRNKDIIYGVIIGLFVPQITFWAIYFGSLNAIPLPELYARPELMSKMVALSLIGNLIVFMVVLKKFNRDFIGRGILMTTFLYAFLILYLKFK